MKCEKGLYFVAGIAGCILFIIFGVAGFWYKDGDLVIWAFICMLFGNLSYATAYEIEKLKEVIE